MTIHSLFQPVITVNGAEGAIEVDFGDSFDHSYDDEGNTVQDVGPHTALLDSLVAGKPTPEALRALADHIEQHWTT